MKNNKKKVITSRRIVLFCVVALVIIFILNLEHRQDSKMKMSPPPEQGQNMNSKDHTLVIPDGATPTDSAPAKPAQKKKSKK